MGCCNENRKNTCGVKTPAICVYYYGYLPEYSKLDKDCVVIEETTEELYTNQEFILESIDTSKLVEDCIEYPRNEDNKILVVDVLQKLQDEVCNLKENIPTETGINISGLDMKCLENEPCFNQNSLTGILQTMIDKLCELEVRVNQLEING